MQHCMQTDLCLPLAALHWGLHVARRAAWALPHITHRVVPRAAPQAVHRAAPRLPRRAPCLALRHVPGCACGISRSWPLG